MTETPEQQTEIYRRMVNAESHAKEAKMLLRHIKPLVWTALGIGLLNFAVIATGAVFLHR